MGKTSLPSTGDRRISCINSRSHIPDMRGSLLRRLFPMREMHRAENFSGKSSELANPEPIISIRSLKDHSFTLPETNSSHLKMDGWKNTIVFLLGLGLFSGCQNVNSRGSKTQKTIKSKGGLSFSRWFHFFLIFTLTWGDSSI